MCQWCHYAVTLCNIVTRLMLLKYLPTTFDSPTRVKYQGIFCDFKVWSGRVIFLVVLKQSIRGNALEWFESYLSGRQQYVTYKGYTSSTEYITCGVPQGSILGPLLFLIYINDLQKVCNSSTPILFADDTNLFYKSHDKSILEQQINNELRQVSLWLKVNKLSLNVSKTHYIVFTRKSNTVTSVDIRIENQAINEVNKTKFLGVIIDKKLTWKEHISYLSSKISRGIGMIIKAKKRLNKDALVTLYYSFIYSYMTYCNHVWGTACITRLNKIIILQKKAIRIICNVNRRTPTDPLFRDLKIVPFLDVNIYSIARFMFRYVNGSLPYLSPLLVILQQMPTSTATILDKPFIFICRMLEVILAKRISNIAELKYGIVCLI